MTSMITNLSTINTSTIFANSRVNLGFQAPIAFSTTTGTHLLNGQAGDLYYDDELLAKANDIQDVADWALYPALSADAPPAQKPSPTYTPKASSSSKKRPTSSSSTSGPKRPRPSPLPVQAHVTIP